MTFAALASGSQGNSTFVRSGDTRILIDCGLSLKTLRERLAAIGERPEDIDAILVTHAHSDHVSGLAVALKESIRRGRAVSIWCTEGTAERIDWQGIECPPVVEFDAGKSFVIGDIGVSSFSVSHDCYNPVGYCLSDNHSRCGIATDLGFIPPAMIAHFRTCDLVMIESNYDPEMLARCDRATDLKKRISSRNGHLSNSETSQYLSHELSDNVRHIVFAHRSKETNTRQLVTDMAVHSLKVHSLKVLGLRYQLAEQDEGTGAIEL